MASKKRKNEFFVPRDQHETLQSEYLACQRKMQSKDEAIRILRKELEFSQEEKEDCIQQMNQIKSFLVDENSFTLYNSKEYNGMNNEDENDSTKRISHLESYIVQLKQKHIDEVQTLKEKLAHARNALSSSFTISTSDLAEERALLISQLEEAQAKIGELRREVQSLEDDKEDLFSERDYFAGKCSYLNKCLEDKGKPKLPSLNTVEHVLEENRKLKIELVECEAEKDSALNKIERYKRAVERRKAKESQNEALQSNLSSSKLSDLRKSIKRVQELDSLANSLSEEIKEKSLALTHQRKTNKLLGTRVAELEHRLKVLEISGLWTTHSTLDDNNLPNTVNTSTGFDETEINDEIDLTNGSITDHEEK